MKLEKYMNEKIDLKNYPELDKIAKDIAKKTGDLINKSVRNVKSEMPYKAQYVLEEVVKILKEAI
jgi:hypothetical protein